MRSQDVSGDASLLPRTKRIRRGWIIEIAVGIAIYFLYDWLRDHATGTSADALRHAKQLVSVEQFLGLYHERSIQQAFVDVHWFMSFWNFFYGTVHFVLPVVALVWLYRKHPMRYLRWRNTLLFMLTIALVGFALWPLTPPRLMPSHYGFIDAAARYYNFGPQVKITFSAAGQPDADAVRQFGNLFAAMPSLHVGWSTWTALALWPIVHRWWAKALLALYPIAVIFGIVVTGNHWLLDAVGGWVALALGYLCAWLLARFVASGRRRPRAATVGTDMTSTESRVAT
ncbi:MAG: phosphatase PAP2 family protein [Acidimicrobiia bacterium]